MKKIFNSIIFFVLISSATAQSVGIGTAAPNSSAILDLNSSSKGILVPRTSTTSRVAIAYPAKGLMLFDTTTNSFWFFDGLGWAESSSSKNNWSLFGNGATNPSTNFIGTIDNTQLQFRVNNTRAGELNPYNRNVNFGLNAGSSNTSGSGNIAIGAATLRLSGIDNGVIAIGDSALANLQSPGSLTTAVGRRAGYSSTNATQNTFIGAYSGEKNTIGYNNSYVGAHAGKSSTTAANNSCFGSYSGENILIGTDNSLFGVFSGRSIDYGSLNSFFGLNSGAFTQSGSRNSFFGALSGSRVVNGNANTIVGFGAVSNAVQSSPDSNTIVGAYAGYNLASGNSNVVVGSNAGYLLSNGYSNVAIGVSALRNNSYGHNLVAVGDSALFNQSPNPGDGYHNTAIGSKALYTNTTGAFNTAIGWQALHQNITGNSNVAVGYGALDGNTTGYWNTAIGLNSDVAAPGLNYATAVGAFATVNCSNCLVLGGTANSHAKVGINLTTPVTDLHIVQQTDAGGDKIRGIRLQRSVNSNHWRTMIDPGNNYVFEYNDVLYSYIEPIGGAFVNPSDSRLKKDIIPLENVLDKILLLSPKKYHYKTSTATDPLLYGFIAQDVQRIFPEFISQREEGYLGIAYSNFGVIAVKAIQEQQSLIVGLQNQNKLQQDQLEQLVKRIEQLEKK